MIYFVKIMLHLVILFYEIKWLTYSSPPPFPTEKYDNFIHNSFSIITILCSWKKRLPRGLIERLYFILSLSVWSYSFFNFFFLINHKLDGNDTNGFILLALDSVIPLEIVVWLLWICFSNPWQKKPGISWVSCALITFNSIRRLVIKVYILSTAFQDAYVVMHLLWEPTLKSRAVLAPYDTKRMLKL